MSSREAFEKWAKSHYQLKFCRLRKTDADPPEYCDSEVETCWEAWQAAQAKPLWETAPPWAQFLAKDINGTWFWFREEPKPGDGEWYDCSDDDEVDTARQAEPAFNTWATSLERRP